MDSSLVVVFVTCSTGTPRGCIKNGTQQRKYIIDEEEAASVVAVKVEGQDDSREDDQGKGTWKHAAAFPAAYAPSLSTYLLLSLLQVKFLLLENMSRREKQ